MPKNVIRTFDDVSRLQIGDVVKGEDALWIVKGKDNDKSYPDLPPPVFTFENVDTGETATVGWWQFGPEQGFCNESLGIVPSLVGARLVTPVAV